MFLENRQNEDECGGVRVYEHGSNSRIRTFFYDRISIVCKCLKL
jgi:hypothetical protein